MGSIHAVTNQAQEVLARYYYNPWGVRKNLNKTTGNDIQLNNDLPWLHRGFTGHEYITEIGLINMNGRVYDPDLGMFISPDPYVQAPDNPLNFNRYGYGLNNPLVYTDPTGEFFFVIPSLSYSSGGLDVSLSVGVGFADIMSAQLTVGYNFGNDNLYGTVGVSIAGASIYGGYGTQSGWMAGASVGSGFNYGDTDFSVGSNLTSIGYNYSEKGGGNYNLSAWNYNQSAGWSFDPNISMSYSFNNYSYSFLDEINPNQYLQYAGTGGGDPYDNSSEGGILAYLSRVFYNSLFKEEEMDDGKKFVKSPEVTPYVSISGGKQTMESKIISGYGSLIFTPNALYVSAGGDLSLGSKSSLRVPLFSSLSISVGIFTGPSKGIEGYGFGYGAGFYHLGFERGYSLNGSYKTGCTIGNTNMYGISVSSIKFYGTINFGKTWKLLDW